MRSLDCLGLPSPKSLFSYRVLDMDPVPCICWLSDRHRVEEACTVWFCAGLSVCVTSTKPSLFWEGPALQLTGDTANATIDSVFLDVKSS